VDAARNPYLDALERILQIDAVDFRTAWSAQPISSPPR
jgi:hypothetical protein